MIRLQGATAFKTTLQRTIAQEEAATRRAVAQGAHLIEQRAKEMLGEQTHERGTPTPSPPGGYPALITGNLRRGVTVNGPTSEMFSGYPGWRAEIGPTAVYGRVQELGGDTGHAVLPARPYMSPAYEDTRPLLRPLFEKAWRGPLML